MYVDWEYYKIFYFVAKYRNFTKAARVLGSNQPNITHTMNKLEDQLHCVLFIRSNRGVTLTPEGEMLYTRISSAAVQIQDAEEELSASATFEHGAISISATETALNIYLSERLRDFHAQYPGIRLRISNHSTPQAIQAVKNGEVDFAVVTTPTGAEGELKKVDLMPFNEILVGGKTFTALASRTLSLQELDAYPLIMLGNESMSRLFYRQFFLEHSADLKPDIEAATTDQMMTLVNEMVRKGELTDAKWSEISFTDALWTIPKERMKRRNPHLVFLSRQALDIFMALKTFAGGSEWVLPSRYDADAPMSNATLNRVLELVYTLAQKDGKELGKFGPHDLRRTASTLLHEAGYNTDWIEKCLAHEQKGVRAVYNKAEYREQRTAMLQDWADMIDGWTVK